MAARQTTKVSSASARVKSAGARSAATNNRPSSNTSICSTTSSGVSSAKQRISKPSDRLNPKTSDPFNKSIPKSVFVAAYTKGTVPCRLCHGSVKHKIQWTTAPESVDYDSTLVLFAQGLKEIDFPYSFVAHEGFVQLLQIEVANEETILVLPKLIAPIKAALMVKDETCFQSTLECLVQLSHVVGKALTEHLKNLLPQISRRLSNSKQYKEKITEALQAIEMNGGPKCTPIIKSRIPTYASVL